MKWLKWLVLAFFAGLLLPQSYGSFLSASVLDNFYDDYDFEEALKAYHTSNDELVNDYLELLLDPDFAEDGYVSYPPDENACTKDNVSTYCLSTALNQNLTEFQKYLEKHKDEIASGESEDGDDDSPITLEAAIKEATAKRQLADEQILLAEQTLDLTLAVYNQVQIVYPVHVELEKLIVNMETYREQLKEIRDLIELYPSKFNGASTVQCK